MTHIIAAERSDGKVLCCYTLVTSAVGGATIPNKKLPASNPVGVVLLARLAVNKDAQGQGLGKRMVLRAMYETALASRTVGIYALTLDALDARARDWYLSLDFGFATFLDDPNHLYMPIQYILQLKQPNLTDEL